MKVGDLVKYRYPETDDDKAIGVVIGTTNHPGIFEILDEECFVPSGKD